ncbi:membrane protein [Caballeronia udeis]|uniref:Membrane protein n=1 Tax=Caballeronia udeis TaxID=1232866 RepID=A0A158GYF2_9BURK|nr:class II aldolase/adducin family protein [Caballeronia udeis]SAL37118.1 membrane protein [Caballeronia udeis]
MRNNGKPVEQSEWDARVELAAVYRLVEIHGWGEGIYNHVSLRVPDEPDHFLIKRHDLLYSEVTASNLVKVPVHGDLDERTGVNRPGFVLHGGVLMSRPDVNCALHVHTAEGIALSACEAPLLMLSQYAARFYGRIGYHPYEGITDGMDERVRIERNLADNSALFMRNHGVLTVASSAPSAFIQIKDLLDACRIQLLLQAAGSNVIEIGELICERTVRQFAQHDEGRGGAAWPAYLRMLERSDTSYAQ